MNTAEILSCSHGVSRYSIQKHKATLFEAPHDKTNKMACVPSEDSDQPGHPPRLI